jgi:hypothetical protein
MSSMGFTKLNNRFLCLTFCVSLLASAASGQVLYTNNFESAQVGQVPDDFLVLAGDFAVKAENGNKFLELPGSPLDSYGVQFGPGGNPELSVSARIKATAKGRRFPTFGLGLSGVAGYRLQVSPGKKLLELYRDQELKGSGPFEWKSGAWTNVRLQVHKDAAGGWRIEGKAWSEGTAEPQWTVSISDKEDPPTGRASGFGSPFAGTPIQFDDLVVENALNPAR